MPRKPASEKKEPAKKTVRKKKADTEVIAAPVVEETPVKKKRAAEGIMAQITERTNFYQGYSSVFGTGIGSAISTPINKLTNKHKIFSQE